MSAEKLCFCDRMNLGQPGVSCGDCPTRDYPTISPAKTTAQRQRTFRARKAEQQMTEVRGIFAHPDDHAAVKAAAVEIARKRRETAKEK